jgi:hypothetical protein
MFHVNVSGMDGIRKSLEAISDEFKRGKATAMAINKVASRAQTEIRRSITERYAIDGRFVRSSMDATLASAKTGKVEARISIFGSPSKKGRSLNMVRFIEKKMTLGAARRLAKANKLYGIGRGGKLLPILQFRIKRGDGLKQIPGTFIGNNGRTVFRRKGKDRLPIEPVQVIGVGEMFGARSIRERVMASIERDMQVEVDRAIRFILSKNK